MNNYTRERISCLSGSSDGGVSKSSNYYYSSDFSSKSGTCSSSACSSRAASPRRKFYPQGVACFSGANPARSPAPSFRRSISTGSSRNEPEPEGPSRIPDSKKSFSLELPRGGGVLQSLRKSPDLKAKERGEFENNPESLQLNGEIKFQNSGSDSVQESDDSRLSNIADLGDCESDDQRATTELEILMRFPLVKHGNKKVVPMNGGKVSESPRGFSACLPIYTILSRRNKLDVDCLDLQRKK